MEERLKESLIGKAQYGKTTIWIDDRELAKIKVDFLETLTYKLYLWKKALIFMEDKDFIGKEFKQKCG